MTQAEIHLEIRKIQILQAEVNTRLDYIKLELDKRANEIVNQLVVNEAERIKNSR